MPNWGPVFRARAVIVPDARPAAPWRALLEPRATAISRWWRPIRPPVWWRARPRPSLPGRSRSATRAPMASSGSTLARGFGLPPLWFEAGAVPAPRIKRALCAFGVTAVAPGRSAPVGRPPRFRGVATHAQEVHRCARSRRRRHRINRSAFSTLTSAPFTAREAAIARFRTGELGRGHSQQLRPQRPWQWLGQNQDLAQLIVIQRKRDHRSAKLRAPFLIGVLGTY
jgi:hypothetical protein